MKSHFCTGYVNFVAVYRVKNLRGAVSFSITEKQIAAQLGNRQTDMLIIFLNLKNLI